MHNEESPGNTEHYTSEMEDTREGIVMAEENNYLNCSQLRKR